MRKQRRRFKACISELEKEIKVREGAIERIHLAFESGAYDIDTYKERLKKAREDISNLDEEIRVLKRKASNQDAISNKERIEIINDFLERIENEKTEMELNKLYKKVIHSIIWTRTKNDEVAIIINFL